MPERRSAKPSTTPEPTHNEPFHLKYRPTTLADVRGQPEVVDALRAALAAKNRQRTYFLFGPTGTGKTTIARILADNFNCSPIEVDAASNSGIDEMRALTASMAYSGFGGRGRAYIIDECQRLSAQAWDSLLKSTEEPPDHVMFFFCSTEPKKIPVAMLSRGPTYHLRAIEWVVIVNALEDVCKAERLDTPLSYLEAIASACGGSMRLALVMLAQVTDCHSLDEVEMLLEGIGQAPEVIDLCRLVVKDCDWPSVIKLIKPIKEKGVLQAEGIRIQIVHYVNAVLLGANERDAPYLLNLLVAFSKPCNSTDGMAPILMAFADVVNWRK